ncbi:hypothetical protein [Mycolicibacterium moriokaense]|uniref:hypothetical protein n=1 Tax=Mycolicibacterium moriokaense TaxID=39691 RepID=UPI0011B3D208|nr:hypothetical protein [Mycolicibacterium moriokaense]
MRSEVLAGMHASEACREVLACASLDSPYVVPGALLTAVFRTQVALGGGGASGGEHLGEAECIVMAEQFQCGVITDDGAAYDLVEKRLGSARVHDTVDVLRALVRSRSLLPSDAKMYADAIVNNGRHLRRTHPRTVDVSYFTQA